MASEAPPFWWGKPDWRAYALLPLSAVYGIVAARRMASARREPVPVPVLCIGNFTVGGAGKTPTAIAMAAAAGRAGMRPGFLSRGHGGSISAPHLVDPDHDSARLVGDEPLLLAAHAPVAVTADRAAGARLLVDLGRDFLIMDDGFQSARVRADHALVVVDARRGLGNGHVVPGGPLRAPLASQMRFADSLLAIGQGEADALPMREAARAGKPTYRASIAPRRPEELAGRPLLAFAGIGDPHKFFGTVAEAGGVVALARAFGDHHAYTDQEVAELAASADAGGLDLVTTSKDAVRLKTGSPAARTLAARVRVLDIDLIFDDPGAPGRIVAATLEAFEKRRYGAGRGD